MDNDHTENARVFKAFCDENRLKILEMLRGGEKCACVLLKTMDISQPTLSHHMKILFDSGIVSARREGKWMYYSISESGADNAARLLRELTAKTVREDGKGRERCCGKDDLGHKNDDMENNIKTNTGRKA